MSEWMPHGNIMEFIRNNPANRLELVCTLTLPATTFIKTQQQLHGVAQGLKYLHGANLTHGDIKGVRTTSPRDPSS